MHKNQGGLVAPQCPLFFHEITTTGLSHAVDYFWSSKQWLLHTGTKFDCLTKACDGSRNTFWPWAHPTRSSLIPALPMSYWHPGSNRQRWRREGGGKTELWCSPYTHTPLSPCVHGQSQQQWFSFVDQHVSVDAINLDHFKEKLSFRMRRPLCQAGEQKHTSMHFLKTWIYIGGKSEPDLKTDPLVSSSRNWGVRHTSIRRWLPCPQPTTLGLWPSPQGTCTHIHLQARQRAPFLCLLTFA